VNSGTFLTVVAIAQGGAVGALLLLVVLTRWQRAWRRSREHPLQLNLEKAMRAWTLGTGGVPAVLLALARLPTPRAVDALAAWVTRVSADRWRELAGALATAPWARAVRGDARSARWWKRLEAARLLSAAAIPADTPLLTRLLRDPHAAVHLAAAGSLERVQTPTLVTAALERLPFLPPTVYAFYSSMLQRARGQVVERLREHLGRTGDPHLARFTEFAARLEEPSLRPALTALAGHPDAEVRVQVARGLGAFPHAESVAALRRLAGDPAWPPRAQAVRSLGKLGDAGSLALLRATLTDPEWWVRLRGALALHRLGGTGRNTLLEAEVGPSPDARDMARLVLGLSPQALAEFAS
jgi:HEAT repeat protein